MTSPENIKAKIEFLRVHLAKPVVLVGLMGSGKTHTGRKLAEHLKLQFQDSDKLVEEKAGRTINEIFSQYGEEKFRQCEKNTMLELLNRGPCVVATGGGAVMNDDVRKVIKVKSVSVWLDVGIQEILPRIKSARNRPLLKSGDPEMVLRELLNKRKPYYAEADIHVRPEKATADETLNILINALYEHLKTVTV